MKFSESPLPFSLLGKEMNEHKGITVGRNELDFCPRDHKLIIKVDVCIKAEKENRFFVELCDTNLRLQYVIILRSDLRYIKNC